MVRNRLWMVGVVLALVAGGCGAERSPSSDGGSAAGGGGGGDCGDLTINEQSWIGSTANVYVAKNLLENELGCTVSITKIAEIPVFEALADGKVDVILEDWQHVKLYKKYVDDLGKVKQAGSLGVTGHIGWYVPKYLVDENPELASWQGVAENSELFQTPESGDQGQFLAGDPGYVTNDQALIETLGLNFKVIYAGGEASEIAAIQQAYAQEEPLLFYWYEPQWLNAALDFVEVKLPKRTPGCDADPDNVDCAYPDYDLRKLYSSEFAESGSPAVEFVENFKWSNADQELVSQLIAEEKMTPEDAAAQWISDNKDKADAWLEGISS
ncbi:ABC transporter substrate-binding protein [soil metagenome]